MGKHLTTYLTDHAAASVAAIELAKRSRENNRGSSLGQYLDGIVPRMENEHGLLKKIIEHMDASESAIKNIAAWGAEKLGRLKLNDAVLSYSELSRLVELEGLIAAAEIKIVMWNALKAYAAENPDFPKADFDGFIKENENMKEKLKEQHRTAARHAFSN